MHYGFLDTVFVTVMSTLTLFGAFMCREYLEMSRSIDPRIAYYEILLKSDGIKSTYLTKPISIHCLNFGIFTGFTIY